VGHGESCWQELEGKKEKDRQIQAKNRQSKRQIDRHTDRFTKIQTETNQYDINQLVEWGVWGFVLARTGRK
jgi:hypothetical protein